MPSYSIPYPDVCSTSRLRSIVQCSKSAFFPRLDFKPSFLFGPTISKPASGFGSKEFSSSTPLLSSKSGFACSKGENKHVWTSDTSSFSALTTQVSNLVKLVDSRDITELQLKQHNCELIIRKKEALQCGPVMGTHLPHAILPSPSPPTTPPAPAPTLPVPSQKPSFSHPPLTSPFDGTFYRSPEPGKPPFVKVGDRVQKGQALCIIEAMKVMNEIEVEESGTIAEIFVEDGKPVRKDEPLLVILP